MQTNKYRELLGATKVISANVIAPNGEGMADAHSMTKDFIEVTDFAVQLKANDSISKLKGLVVDDIAMNLDIMTHQRVAMGLRHVATAPDGFAAMAELERAWPAGKTHALAFLDHIMPGPAGGGSGASGS